MYKPKCNCGAFTLKQAKKAKYHNRFTKLSESVSIRLLMEHLCPCPVMIFDLQVRCMQAINYKPMHKTLIKEEQAEAFKGLTNDFKEEQEMCPINTWANNLWKSKQ